MADENVAPLTDAERAELEALRAEKRRREAEEQARRDRAELEALRAEHAASAVPTSAVPAAGEKDPGYGGRTAAGSHAAPAAPAPARKSREEMSFGERMVATPELKEGEEVPGMPPAQKIVIALAVLLVIAAAVYIVTQG